MTAVADATHITAVFVPPLKGGMLFTAAELFATELKPKRPPFDRWVESLPVEDRKLFLEYAPNPDLSNQAMLRIARQLGASVSKDTIAVWRRGHGLVS